MRFGVYKVRHNGRPVTMSRDYHLLAECASIAEAHAFIDRTHLTGVAVGHLIRGGYEPLTPDEQRDLNEAILGRPR